MSSFAKDMTRRLSSSAAPFGSHDQLKNRCPLGQIAYSIWRMHIDARGELCSTDAVILALIAENLGFAVVLQLLRRRTPRSWTLTPTMRLRIWDLQSSNFVGMISKRVWPLCMR